MNHEKQEDQKRLYLPDEHIVVVAHSQGFYQAGKKQMESLGLIFATNAAARTAPETQSSTTSATMVIDTPVTKLQLIRSTVLKTSMEDSTILRTRTGAENALCDMPLPPIGEAVFATGAQIRKVNGQPYYAVKNLQITPPQAAPCLADFNP